MSTTVIGIDFGTTTSRVAIYKNNHVKIINNERDSRQIPSCVAFTGHKILVGEEAIHNINLEPENTICGVKQLIGSAFNGNFEEIVNKYGLFSLVSDNNLPKIKIKHEDGERRYTPEEITTIILTKLKETAEKFLRRQVSEAIIVVPSYFRDSQRRAIISAGHEAGLFNIRFLNESLAAVITYISRKPEVHGNLLVLSIGSGPLDISVLSVDNMTLLVKSIGLNNRVGGQDFTESLVKYFMGSFRKKHKKLKISKQAVWRLRDACEAVKKKLSSSLKIKLEVQAFTNDLDIDEFVTRKLFNELNYNNLLSVQSAIRKVLVAVKMSYNDISKVILVGGSSRIPEIQNRLKAIFGIDKVLILPNPDEAAICGALTYECLRQSEKIIVYNILPRPLKYCFDNNKTLQLIHQKNTFVHNNVPSTYDMEIEIPPGVRFLTTYEEEGDNKVQIGNYVLKTFEYDLPRKVVFRLDDNRVLNVIALYEHEMPIRRRQRKIRTII